MHIQTHSIYVKEETEINLNAILTIKITSEKNKLSILSLNTDHRSENRIIWNDAIYRCLRLLTLFGFKRSYTPLIYKYMV